MVDYDKKIHTVWKYKYDKPCSWLPSTYFGKQDMYQKYLKMENQLGNL